MVSARKTILLCVILSIAPSSIAFGQTTIGPVPDDMIKYPGIEPWMVQERNIEFYRRGWWLLGYDSTMKVKWGRQDVFVKDLTEQQKTYLWEMMSHEQRRQMSDEYAKIGFGMGGHLRQRPAEWGPTLNARIAAYFRGVNGWTEVARRRHQAKIPPEVPAFIAEKNEFVQKHADKLTGQQIDLINREASGVEMVGGVIATLELKKIEIAVKGLSAGLIGIITDYMTGFITHGASAASDAAATILSKMIDLGRGAADKTLSPGEQLQVLNQQIALARSEMLADMDRQRAMWKQMIGEEEEEEERPEPLPGAAPERSICYLVDVSGSMSGRKLEEAKQAVRLSIAATDDGRTEWALLSFGGCSVDEVHGFTSSAAGIIGAVDGLSAGGDTPMTFAMYKATTYMADEAGGTRSRRLIVLCDGQDNCRERGSVTQEEAMDGLKTIVREMPLPATGGM